MIVTVGALGRVERSLSLRRVQLSPGRQVAGRVLPLVVVAMVGVLSLTACGVSDGRVDAGSHVCSGFDSAYCNEVSDHPGAYAPSHGRLFCDVLQLRERVIDGAVDLDELMARLPDWGDGAFRNERPVIVDVRGTPRGSADERHDAVLHVGREVGWSRDWNDYEACLDTVSQETLEEELGGPLNAGS